MSRAVAISLGLALAPSGAIADPVTEKVGAVTLDHSAGVVEAPGAGAADLHLPSAQVARFKAERTAREHAIAQLDRALAALPPERLGCKLPSGEARKAWLAEVAKRAEKVAPSNVEWGSDGSVELSLRLPIELLATAPANGEDARKPVVLVDPKARPTLLSARGEGCGPAPRFFATLAEARATPGGEWRDAPATHERPGSEARVVAIVRSDSSTGDGR